MATILLSFVGSQDPYSNTTQQPGSIVSLVAHLQAHHQPLKRALLLYTAGTQSNAMDTRDWLLSESTLTEEAIELIAVDEALSQDPVDSRLAVQEARRALERAKQQQTSEDWLAFNTSSGTPAMKTAWSILQAAGYAPNSQVWQVRNPNEIRAGQERVFPSNLDFLKREFDLKVAKQQVQDYNYSGALMTLGSSQLLTDEIAALLHYGYYRSSRDFDRADASLGSVRGQIDSRWTQEMARLRQKDVKARLQEAYFNAQIRLKNQKYADFLIDVFGLQECLLKHLVERYMGLPVPDRAQTPQFWERIKQVDQGKLYRHLQNYRLPKGGSLRLDESVSRYGMIAILEYVPQLTSVMPLINYLNDYCDLRNRAVHEFAGVSEIQDQEKLLSTLKTLMKRVTSLPETNPFDDLNWQICQLLDQALNVAT
ncbi:hypothetical protein HJG54_13975 [Leptolyngbya sp. NK1-12]|uniref:CRISPR-associated protein n=1 Tax=Leptolyngbya sp. NK1-12 TaxID=2547451 RepID=A0AA96WES4_9CYAN|nr:hypothetical protein [Leptolyngbya sp. NK1-12]WNZ23854.1 hypothetical protein HJG54_13975 [Leptolyngbya sp. NK1-12]